MITRGHCCNTVEHETPSPTRWSHDQLIVIGLT